MPPEPKNLVKLMPLLVSMRALIDATLLELAEQGHRPVTSGGLFPDKSKKICPKTGEPHRLLPGMGPTGTCLDCEEIVEREAP